MGKINQVDYQKLTQDYFNKGIYKVGDRFTEMMSFWIYIVSINNDLVVTIEGTINSLTDLRSFSGPLSIPTSSLVLKEYTSDEFKKYCKYSSISTLDPYDDKYWVYFLGNNINTTKNLLKFYKNRGIGNTQLSRQIKIEEITYDI